eukprot:364358-Chlamydomonas_euryale.AAC.2
MGRRSASKAGHMHRQVERLKGWLPCCIHAQEERAPTLSTSPRPSMVYDYSGFPPESYKLKVWKCGGCGLWVACS